VKLVRDLPFHLKKYLVGLQGIIALCLAITLVFSPERSLASQGQDLNQIMNAPFPMSQLVDKAIGGAQKPEVVASTFITAIKRFNGTDKAKFNKRYREIVRGIDSALTGSSSKPSGLSRGFQSHRTLLGKLDGATIRLRQPGAFLEPIEGGEDLSLNFDALGTLLAASAIDDLSRKRVSSAQRYARHLLQMGRLISGAARTINELEAAVTMIRKGLAILSLAAVEGKKPDEKEAERLRLLGIELTDFEQRLSTIRREMRQPSRTDFWAKVAAKNSKLLWQHVALDALALIGRSTDGSKQARDALKGLSRRHDRIGIAAGVRLSRLK